MDLPRRWNLFSISRSVHSSSCPYLELHASSFICLERWKSQMTRPLVPSLSLQCIHHQCQRSHRHGVCSSWKLNSVSREKVWDAIMVALPSLLIPSCWGKVATARPVARESHTSCTVARTFRPSCPLCTPSMLPIELYFLKPTVL